MLAGAILQALGKFTCAESEVMRGGNFA